MRRDRQPDPGEGEDLRLGQQRIPENEVEGVRNSTDRNNQHRIADHPKVRPKSDRTISTCGKFVAREEVVFALTLNADVEAASSASG